MKVNLDGMRMSATSSMNALANEIESSLEYLPDWKIDELKEVYNDAATSVGFFNCVYDDKNESFNDLSEKIKIRRFDVD